MLNITLDEQHGIATLEPDGPLGKDDFHSAAGIIDPFIEKSGHLNGLIIHTLLVTQVNHSVPAIRNLLASQIKN